MTACPSSSPSKHKQCKSAASVAAKVQHMSGLPSTTMSYSNTSSPAPGASSKLAAKGQLQQYNIQRLHKFAKNDTPHEEWQLQQ